MRMIRTMLAVLVFAGIACTSVAKSVSEQQARQVASKAWTEHARSAALKSISPADGEMITILSGSSPVYHVFNLPGAQGFILIAADDRVTPVLGWSDHGSFTAENHPPAFDGYMEGITQQILLALRSPEPPASDVAAEWKHLLSPGLTPVKTLDAGPLLQTTWDQGCYYNELCPADPTAGSYCYHALTGCGATAMAQIMKYWSYPAHGTGSHGYTHLQYGYLFADFAAATYNYSAMPASLSSGNTEIAKLIYHCGVAQDMDYGPDVSTSSVTVVDDAFRDYFGYDPALDWKIRSDFPVATWASMLRAEIDAGRPLFYYGNDNGAVGHAFVCDGYQGTDYFHFNWGWSGTYDGFFYLGDLTPGGNVFSDNQRAIFGLQPAVMPSAYIMDFESQSDFSLTFNPWTVADVDGSMTYGITNYNFPHSGDAMAFIAFNPAQVTPSMATDPAIQPHGGARFGASFSATTPPSSDWFISPKIQMNYNGSFSLWVKSYTSDYGLEQYKVAVSTTDNNPSSFTVISGPDALLAPTAWTKVNFDLSAYNGQEIYVGVHCISNDAFIFMIDDLEVDPGVTGTLIANFTADKTTLGQGGTVNFTDLSVGNPTSWEWTFQGGTPNASTGQNPTNIKYNSPGIYDVSLTVSDGTNSNTKTRTGYIVVNQTLPSQMTMDFENLSDFTTMFDPWTTVDVNGGQTYEINGYTFPGSGNPMSWICFNPSATTPPLTTMSAHSGAKLGASFASPVPYAPNNKWLITPKMHLGTNGKLELWVQSFVSDYGLEKYNVGVSETGNQPGDFTIISGINPVEAPVTWVMDSYSLSDYAGKDVYIGIQCVSNDAFIFMIDDLSITSTVGVEEKPATSLRVYPNPAHGSFRISFTGEAPPAFTAELFNTVGASIRNFSFANTGNAPVTVHAEDLPGGVYFLKISYGQNSITKKVIIID